MSLQITWKLNSLKLDLKQKCQNYGGISRRKVCCASTCGKCGGRGCGRRPGGKFRCCGSRIKRTCGVNGQRAPCIIDGKQISKLSNWIFCRINGYDILQFRIFIE